MCKTADYVALVVPDILKFDDLVSTCRWASCCEDSKDSPQGAAGSCTSGSPASMTLAVEIDKKSSTLTFRQEPFFGDLEVLDDLQNVKVTLPNQPIRSN